MAWTTLREALIERLRACGWSYRKISRASGVAIPVIHRLLNQHEITLTNADRLAKAFGLIIVEANKKNSGKEAKE